MLEISTTENYVCERIESVGNNNNNWQSVFEWRANPPNTCPVSTLCQYSVNIAAFFVITRHLHTLAKRFRIFFLLPLTLRDQKASCIQRLRAATSTWSKDIQVWADLSDDDPRLWDWGIEQGGDLIILQSSDTTPDPPISDSRPNNNFWQIRIVICSRTPDYEAMTNWGEVGSGDRDEKLWPSLTLPAKQLPGTDSSRPPVHCGRQTHTCT